MGTFEELESKIKDELSLLRKSRGTHKRKVTIHLKKIKQLFSNETLTSSLYKLRLKDIEYEKECIRKYDDKINEVMDENDLEIKSNDTYMEELNNQTDCFLQIDEELNQYEEFFKDDNASGNPTSSIALLNLAAQLNISDGKPPSLDCGTFHGKEKDKFAFKTF